MRVMGTGCTRRTKCIEGDTVSLSKSYRTHTLSLLVPPPSPPCFSLPLPPHSNNQSHQPSYMSISYHRSAIAAAASVPLTEVYRDTSHVYNNDHDHDDDDMYGVYEENEVYHRSAIAAAASVPLTEVYRDTNNHNHSHSRFFIDSSAAGGPRGDVHPYENAAYRQWTNANNNNNNHAYANANAHSSWTETDVDAASTRASARDAESTRASARDPTNTRDIWGFASARARAREEGEGDRGLYHPLPSPSPSPQRLSGDGGGGNGNGGGGNGDGGGGSPRGRQLFGPPRRGPRTRAR